MRIILAPCRMDATLSLSKSGDVLTINGTDFDFSGIPDGNRLPQEGISSPFVQEVRRGGELQVTIILPIGADASEDQRFPAPIENVPDGAVSLPQGGEGDD